jgi:Rrf2 family protein
MRLTRATEYAFRAVRFLASRHEERWFSIQEIAEAEGMPIQFLAKVMQHLTQASLVHSACGKTGGYRLGRAPTEITMSDVFVAMEGPLAVNSCLIYPGECRFEKTCRVHPVWEELQAAMLGVLGKYRLSDIVSTGTPVALPDRPRGRARRPKVVVAPVTSSEIIVN